MLEFYLTTVVIWAIIIYATATSCGQKIKENGWIKDDASASRGLLRYICVIFIPGIRSILWMLLLIMYTHTEEELEGIINK